jgi:hypothetical protein
VKPSVIDFLLPIRFAAFVFWAAFPAAVQQSRLV